MILRTAKLGLSILLKQYNSSTSKLAKWRENTNAGADVGAGDRTLLRRT